ncbi:MAG TPA: FemAB family XrtA/PEP-CTERM system-associated protein [Alphaproteobacteria bacterium]|nr:FemAB family XrtA/PEP-CTERM system-associated protein [Alphaproteobacteria bacterium]
MSADLEFSFEPDAARWDVFVASQPGSTFFQRAGWRDVMANAYGHKSHFLSAQRGGAIAGVLPLVEIKSPIFGHSLISTAFCTGGGPLAADAETRDALLAQAESLGRKLNVDYIEIRDATGIGRDWVPKEGLYFGFERKIAAAEDECLKQIPRKQRAVVRKTLESKLTFKVDQDVATFYALHARTFRNHGTPVFPKRFYENLVRVFGQDCDILTVWDETTPVSSVLSYYTKDRVTPYFTGSVQAARGLGSNDFMYWELMRHAVARGCTEFDFGRSKVDTGPFAFKKNWGFEPRPMINWYYLVRGKSLPNMSPTNPKFSTAIKVWQSLPLPVANFLSQFVSPSLG